MSKSSYFEALKFNHSINNIRPLRPGLTMERTTHDAALLNRVIHLQALFLAGQGGNEKPISRFCRS
jgi:hypothetical protein